MKAKSSRTYAAVFAILILFTTPILANYHPAFATSSTGVMIPLYSYPGSYWTQVIQAKNAHPSVPIIAIINPSNGPGSSIDSNYVSGIQQMQSAGIIVLGYVYSSYGSRSASSIETDINSYINWYHVSGIFFDEMSNVAGYETYYSTLSNYAHSHGMTMTVGNPGTDTLSSYVGTMDNLVIYESPGLPTPSSLGGWHTSYLKSNFSLISFGVGLPSQSIITTYSSSVAYVYITDNTLPNPYNTVPSYLGAEVGMLDIGSPLTVPQPPTALTATTVSSSLINLSWTAPANNGGSPITGYKIERSTDSGTTWSTIITNSASTTTTYSNTGLTASTAYTYRVSAINSVGTSPPSNTASATTPAAITVPQVLITVKSVDLSGTSFTGMWTTLISGTTTIATGYTPMTYTVNSGNQYTVTVANYQNYVFDHWSNGSTNPSITVTPTTQNTTLVAYYSTPVQITVKSVDLSGTSFTGMWTTLISGTTTIATGYTPMTYTVNSGNQYTVTVANYQNYVFDHWSNGSTNSSITVTPTTQNTTLVAYYNK